MSSSSVGFQVSLIRFSSSAVSFPCSLMVPRIVSFRSAKQEEVKQSEFPFGYVAQLIVLLFYLLYLHFIQSAGGFFTVTTDEGNRSTFTQKMERTTYLSFRYTQKTGNHLVK